MRLFQYMYMPDEKWQTAVSRYIHIYRYRYIHTCTCLWIRVHAHERVHTYNTTEECTCRPNDV